MNIVPTKTEIRNYAIHLFDLFGQEANFHPDHIAGLCDYVAESADIRIEIMVKLLASENPIFWRHKVHLHYPHPKYLVACMRQFEVYHKTVMTGKFNHVEVVFWTLGALFRSIKPFDRGNAIIGHLIENHARQRHNLRWRFKPLNPDIFHRYHQTVFCRHYKELLP
jgi:hypothetical protein